MKIQYTYDQKQNLYIAKGFAETVNTSIFTDADTFAELEESVADAIETAFMEKAEEINSVAESTGSFTKFQMPKPIFEKVEFETYYD